MTDPIPPHEIPIEQLLPHRPPMRAIDRLDRWSSEGASASLTLRADGLYFEGGRFRPIWCLELMAQAVAAGVGYGAALGGDTRERAGMVIGAEEVRLNPSASLRPGRALRIESRVLHDIPPIAEIETSIIGDGETLASGRLRMLVGAAPAPGSTATCASSLSLLRSDEKQGTVAITVGSEHPWLAGHFPGLPVLPAIGQLGYVEEAAALLLGKPCDIESIARARFQEPIVPGDALELAVEHAWPAISWTFTREGRPIARGSATLR